MHFPLLKRKVLCSDFLESEFHLTAKMNVEASMRRLVRLGLLTQAEDGSDSYQALPVAQASSGLQRAWGPVQTSPPQQRAALASLTAAASPRGAARELDM